MKWRKFMHDSFKSNNMAWSGVTAVSGSNPTRSIESLTSDLYYHYYDANGTLWKLSGATTATASGQILEDSDTTSITVTTSFLDYSGQTKQLTVTNQDGLNVISECTFLSNNLAVARVSAAGLVTIIYTGTTTIKTTHADGPTGSTAVTGYWPGPVTLSPLSASGATGTTVQFTLTSDPTSVNITTQAAWTISATGATIDAATGLVTITAGAPNQVARVYATYKSGAESSYYQPSTTLTIFGGA